MIPIHSLIARIVHDREFGRGRWEISYLDRARPELVRVPFDRVHPRHHIGFVFDVVDEEGVTHSIPYHRVRHVWRDGKLVWTRLAARPRKKTASQPRPPRRQKAMLPRMRRS